MKLAPLPLPPAGLSGSVIAWSAPLTLPTYEPAAADKNPMFLEKRVFQGSSGRVYPLPFFDRIKQECIDKEWQALHIENAYLRVTVLPELGGRIYAMVDKINGRDVIYRNRVIKPALVGLAGPWLSGGIEFNWPQHHRPSTYMPVSWVIEPDDDGGQTIWLSEHEPMSRMKGMHGVHLSPESSCLELKVRLYNRTQLTQTFLWWANVATDVNESYQSFFPEDVHFVADHAKRAMSSFPLCEGRYYGVDYASRARHGVPETERPSQFVPGGGYAANDLRWYANIPVPTSYMCIGSQHDFFGGYDHAAKAGIVHIADHHISPGKKQWTWGNHDFGYAWDRNLTEPDEEGVYHPYIEIMAGVFTDNQPDFSFLSPGETKTFSQYWYPIREIGAAAFATLDAAIGIEMTEARAKVGVQVTRPHEALIIQVMAKGRNLERWTGALSPADPVILLVDLPGDITREDLRVRVTGENGLVLAERLPQDTTPAEMPAPATEPPLPAEISSVEEAWVTGVHLAQYRHATRSPVPYWQSALKRDPLHSRSNTSLGFWHLQRGEFAFAEECFRKAIKRLVQRNPNPSDGEAFYGLGVCLRFQDRENAAFDAFAKAAWNSSWAAPSHLAMAELEARRGRVASALSHVAEVLRHDTENLGARDLKAELLLRQGGLAEASAVVKETLALDPLDPCARHLAHLPLEEDDQLILDLAIDNARAGFFHEALRLVEDRVSEAGNSASPLLFYYGAFYSDHLGLTEEATRLRKLGADACRDYCFPSRLEDMTVLEAAIAADGKDAAARYYLGLLFYDRRRHEEAIDLWEQSAAIDPNFSVVWRNLGIGYFNVAKASGKALAAYDKAVAQAPADARLIYERDQLWKRLGKQPEERLQALLPLLDLVQTRDDLSIELCALFNQIGRHEEADALLARRVFQPWEGGEGLVLDQWVRSKLGLGRKALEERKPDTAIALFESALTPPVSLGEARHLLANQSDVHYWIGRAKSAAGDVEGARAAFALAADFAGDFLGMEVREFSEKTYYSAMSLKCLGRKKEAADLLQDLAVYAGKLMQTPAKIDYFATSLPAMLLFEDDLQTRRQISAHIMLAQVALAENDASEAHAHLHAALALDPNQQLAADLMTELREPHPA